MPSGLLLRGAIVTLFLIVDRLSNLRLPHHPTKRAISGTAPVRQ